MAIESEIGLSFVSVMTNSYNKLTFAVPQVVDETKGTITDKSVDTLWTKSGTQAISLLGLAAEFEWGFSPSMSLITGLRYRFFKDFIAKTDWDFNNPDQYLEINQADRVLAFILTSCLQT